MFQRLLLVLSLLTIGLGVLAQDKKLNPNDPAGSTSGAYLLPLDPTVVHGVLKNGVHYYIKRNAKPEHRAELRLAVNAGSMEEDEDQLGYAHLIEHMAFNGTIHYKHNDLVNYLESIGIKFGADLNAYTSFDETVYMLQVPTDKDPAIKKDLEILTDWANGQLLDSSEIEKERGVVMEEWRLGQGANERMRRQILPVIFANSRYAERIPIGKPEIIQHGTQSALKRFYTKWYRPELEAIIVVGDIDPQLIEKTLQTMFEKYAPAVPEKDQIKVNAWRVEPNKTLAVKAASDKEAPSTTINLSFRLPDFKYRTAADYRQYLIYQIAADMLSDRLKEMTMGSTPSFLYAGAYWGGNIRAVTDFTSWARVSPDKVLEGVHALVKQNMIALKFGFLGSEMNREKEALKTRMETQFNERNKTESREIVDELVSYYLKGEAYTGIEKENELFKSYINTITVNDINEALKTFITHGANANIITVMPEKEGIHIPTDSELRAEFDNAINDNTITAYVDKAAVGNSLLTTQPVAGKITATKEDAENNITTYTLSNGTKVIIKPTSFKNDEIIFSALAPGGSSTFKDEESKAVELADEMQDAMGYGNFDAATLDKLVKSKQIQIGSNISSNQSVIYGSTTPKDIETLMQLVYLRFTAPRYNENDAKAFLAKKRDLASSRLNDPNTCFRDSVIYFMYHLNKRYKPLEMTDYMQMLPEKIEGYYKSRFSAINNFTFTFVGNFKKEQIVPLLEKYIASIEPGKKETYGMLPSIDPSGGGKIFIKGEEQRSSVHLVFNGFFDYTRLHRIQVNALMKVLSIKLRENLREDKSGVYGVGAIPSLVHFPESSYAVHILFSCAPSNVDLLITATLDEIHKLQQNGCDSVNLVKVKETLLRERESQLKENNFWLNVIANANTDGESVSELKAFNEQVNSMTGDMFKDWAKLYLNEASLKRYIMNPVVNK